MSITENKILNWFKTCACVGWEGEKDVERVKKRLFVFKSLECFFYLNFLKKENLANVARSRFQIPQAILNSVFKFTKN